MMVQSLQTDNRFLLPATYRLKPLKEASGLDLRAAPYKESTRPTPEEKSRPLAPVIDALLMEGKLTMKGLAREVRRRASAACWGKDTIPIKLRRITNGERVIWQTGLDECEVKIVDGTDDLYARLQELLSILDDAERQMRKRRKVQIPSGPKTTGAIAHRKNEGK